MATLSAHDAIQGETPILCDGADDAKLSVDLKASKESIWAAAGFIDILLRWKMKLEVEDGYQKEIQPGVQIRGCQAG